MGKCDPQNPNPREWRVLYRKTILETSRSTIAKELSDRRTRSLVAGVTSFRTAELKLNKREALNDALYAVEALRIALELKTRAS